mmetsp:Transcript_41304/g.62912  ORF Transcript_41304/g.62912 Transcript_41304/m.62912 type:complete len:83 (+) Transcript_41304:5513-5761(+)
MNSLLMRQSTTRPLGLRSSQDLVLGLRFINTGRPFKSLLLPLHLLMLELLRKNSRQLGELLKLKLDMGSHRALLLVFPLAGN